MPDNNLRLSQLNPALTTTLPRLGLGTQDLADDFRRHFSYTLGRDRYCQSVHYVYEALVLTLRDRLAERWKDTLYAYQEHNQKRAYYLSLEFLVGRALGNAMLNLGILEETRAALKAWGVVLDEIIENEHDAGLGNGGLGRLAACFLDSCATLKLPVTGYGIRYEYGMFRQHIHQNEQVEEPDHWLRNGNPWEIERPECTVRVRYHGHTEYYHDEHHQLKVRWVNTHDVLAVPYDIPIPGYRNGVVNILRLWKSAATDEFDLGEFNSGSYTESVAAKNAAEHITMVLYPNDASENGKELRLRQQYFLASASLQDILRDWVKHHGENFDEFAGKNVFQLNDTHPSCSVPELMRLLMDEHHLGWDKAWSITTKVMAYTNHTLLPEALERWPVRFFANLLPRLLEIIYEINARFLNEVASKWPGDIECRRRMSIVEEGDDPHIRMAYLALVGSFSVNGVAALHSKLLSEGLFRDFHDLWPQKFNNKTNGVTPRRWLALSNPELSAFITETLGDESWLCQLEKLSGLAAYADNTKFQQRWRQIKHDNKRQLAELVEKECGVCFDPHAMFDVQVKRIHEYKRQLLNVLHVIHLYDRIKRRDTAGWVPRCVLIGGKAAPGYFMAKRIIRLINHVAKVINHDPEVGNLLKVAFFPDYRVSAMEIICASTDLSEQISTAGKEASGTGNMKFMMNGAITIGTLDGANIEIREAVGAENFFLFGLEAHEVEWRRQDYNPSAIVADDENLRRVMSLIENNHFSQFEPGIFDVIRYSVLNPHDPWMVAADFASFVQAQQRASEDYRDQKTWTKMSILNTAASGRFSTDRTIQEYNRDIWHLSPVAVAG